MSSHSKNSTDFLTSQHLSGVLKDWMEAVYQLEYWNTRLQTAIDKKSNTVSYSHPIDNTTQTQLIEFMRLKLKISYGLVELEKEMIDATQADLALDALRLIEHTLIIQQWCFEIKQKLG